MNTINILMYGYIGWIHNTNTYVNILFGLVE